MDQANNTSAAQEVAEAEAQLKAAQERLDAARQRMANEQQAGQPQQPTGQVPANSPYAAAYQYGQQAQSAQASYQPAGQQPAGQPYGQPAEQPGQAAAQQPYGHTVQPGQPAAQQQAYGQQAYGAAPQQQASYNAAAPQQPYAQQYQQPYMPPSVGAKDHVAAGLLAIFLGWLGVHKFYLGYNTSGFIMLGVSVLGGIITLSVAVWAIWLIGIVEGIIYLTKNQTEFEQLYVLNKREWF